MYGTYIEASMAAAQVIATQQWDATEKIFGRARTETLPEPTGPGSNLYEGLAAVARTPSIFAYGLAAAMTGSSEAPKSVATLQEMSRQQTKTPIPFVSELRQAAGIQALEIAAAAHATIGNLQAALAIMEQAARTIDAMPAPAGPPPLIKPVHELCGEILLSANRPQEAAEQFTLSLRRHPNRARSLLGAARAFAQTGQTSGAAQFYGQLAQQWQQADGALPELREARNYLKQASAPRTE